ncbi:MAG TPA: hypothetical protein VF813_05665 [Anaerolineaceae bacterium]
MRAMGKFRFSTLLVILGFLLSLGLVIIFTIRGLHALPRGHMGEPIRPWMSVPYIARSYDVPTAVLFQALGLPDDPRDRRPVAVIAREQHRTIRSAVHALYQAIVQANPTFIPPTPIPFDPGGDTP